MMNEDSIETIVKHIIGINITMTSGFYFLIDVIQLGTRSFRSPAKVTVWSIVQHCHTVKYNIHAPEDKTFQYKVKRR